jgi:diaminohydroxyphosphoribosylaminopyrimidine deaminase/5-amino-6-(5-phosphoribosylamino)uracil reductase
VARVVGAVEDPNPEVAGRGFDRLRQAGVQVDVGPGEPEARRQNRPFFSAMRRGRPYVIVKAVTSLDGRVAAVGGGPTRLSSPATDRRTHLLRAEVDAIAVGSGTMLSDDPLLTARGVYRRRPLARVIFDRRLRTPVSSRVFTTLEAGPVILLAAPGARAGSARALESAGAQVVPARGSLADTLRLLVPMGLHSVLVEGGPTVHAALWREQAVDAVRLVVAPRALGTAGVPWLEHPVAPWASWRLVSVQPCGDDVIIEADVHWTD